MALMGEKDKRFRKLERKVGAFVVLALAGIIVIILFIGVQRDVFTPKVKLYFTAHSASGLTEGQPVKFKGFRIGKVSDVSLNDSAEVEVTALINKKHMRWVRGGAEAVLIQEGVIGETVIEVTPGTGPQLEEDAMLPFRRSTGVGDVVQELKGQVEEIIKEINSVVQYVNDPDGDVKTTLANLNSLSAGMLQTRKNLDRLLVDQNAGFTNTLSDISSLANELEEGVVPRINNTLDSIEVAFDDVDGVINSVDSALPEILDDLRASLRELHSIASDIAKAASDVPPVIQEGGLLVDDTREVVGAVKEIWPIKDHVEVPEEQTLEVDSYE